MIHPLIPAAGAEAAPIPGDHLAITGGPAARHRPQSNHLHAILGGGPARPSNSQDALGVMDRSLDWAARHFGVNRTSILSRSRKQPAAAARQACMWLARQSLGLTVADLGYMFGRHYSSVIFACQAIDGYRDVYPEFRAALDSALVMVIRSDRARPLAGPPP